MLDFWPRTVSGLAFVVGFVGFGVGMLSSAGLVVCKSFLKVYAAATSGPSWAVSLATALFELTGVDL